MERRRRKRHDGVLWRKMEKWQMEEELRGHLAEAVPPAEVSHSLRRAPASPAEHWSTLW